MKIKNIIVVSVCLILSYSSFIYAGFNDKVEFVPYHKRLSLRAVDNQTMNSYFKMYYSNGDSLAMLFPQSIFLLKPEELFLQENEIFCLQCVKGGSFLTIYMKDEGKAGGQAPDGFHGPYCISMWLNYPDVSDEQKQYTRYVVKLGQQGEFSVRINPEGDCQIIALSNLQFLP